MGELIVLNERRADRSRGTASTRPAFFFDVACPFSYLAAERIERALGDVEWMPTAAVAFGETRTLDSDAVVARAEHRARTLRLPLVWPERFPAHWPRALRAAAYAADHGAGARFALAACRLAFCGGFDLDDPEILAETAAAAGVPLAGCLSAAADTSRDLSLHATARGLRARAVTALPAIRIGQRWFAGEESLGQAAALLRAWSVYGRPLAPAG